MKLPNGNQALIDNAKLREYCLSPVHPRGRHKAALFKKLLGLTIADVDLLRDFLQDAARNAEAVETKQSPFGQHYSMEFTMNGPTGQARVLSVWIIRSGESVPRLITCYPLE